MRLRTRSASIVLVLLGGLMMVSVGRTTSGAGQEFSPPKWKSWAIPEAQGQITEVEGKKTQVRYRQAPFSGVRQYWGGYRTYAYDDTQPPVTPVTAVFPHDLKGDAAEGRKIFMSRDKGPCTGCHLVQGKDVWPAGNIGTDLSNYGDKNLSDDFVYQVIFDPRAVYPKTAATMPPWGAQGALTPQEIIHLVAFLKTQKSPLPPDDDPDRNPNTRPKPPGFGDNLDPTNNPAVLMAESAMEVWLARRSTPAGEHPAKACADCHGRAPEKTMKGVAVKYPRYVAKYGRMMSMEDYLQVHGYEETGLTLPSESEANLNVTMMLRMASNGMPVDVDVTSAESRAAWERGKASFYKKVGQRDHACADCHTAGQGKGAGRFLGGRMLADVEDGLTRHFPTFRTNFSVVWDIRKRMQWCMMPLGMNMLPSDSVEYAELELYLTSFDNGKPLSVPGIRH